MEAVDQAIKNDALELNCKKYSFFSLQDFILRMCLASMIYYVLWTAICYVHDLVCDSARVRMHRVLSDIL